MNWSFELFPDGKMDLRRGENLSS